jgi:predicted permease
MYAILNICGLAVGIAVCLIIFAVIQFHLRFDNFHADKEHIYRVLTEYHHADAPDVFYGKGVAEPLPAALRNQFPELKKVTGIYASSDDQVVVLGENGQAEKKFKEASGVFAVEPSFFDIFHFPWIAGSPASLKDPQAVALTKEVATRYFGDWKKAMGRSLKLDNQFLLKVTGVLEDIPSHTDFNIRMVTSYAMTDFAASTNWSGTNSNHGCFFVLPAHVKPETFLSQLRTFTRRMLPPEDKDSHVIQPLAKVHFDTDAGGYSGQTIGYQRIQVLWLIAAFILLIACSNFINLSTAQAINRSKEVGVRKVLGSSKWQLKKQFITEAFLITVLAGLLGLLLAALAIPAVRSILQINVSIDPFRNGVILLFLLLVVFFVTLLAGFYPSVVLSRFNPIHALKSGVMANRARGISVRRALVVFQFMIAQFLIIGTLVLLKQMNYFNSQPLGFARDAIVNVPLPLDSVSITKFDYLRNELKKMRGVQEVSFSSNTPAEDNTDNWTTFRYNGAPKETDFYAITKFCDAAYVPLYKLELVAGRNLVRSDTVNEFLVNESLLKSLAIHHPADILGKELRMWDDKLKGRIVGVLKDYHNRSFRAPFAPMLIASMKKWYGLASIQLSTATTRETMASVEQLWNRTFPEFVYEYRFLDEKIAGFYKQEHQLSRLYRIFAALSIFLSCLGLYGLASFMAVRRIKEVGIRKVLGATAGHVVYLFSKEFLLLIGLAFLIATPVAWYFLHQWLQDYVYRIHLGWWLFAAGGIVSLVIALGTVSIEAIKAAVANPVKSLRTE